MAKYKITQVKSIIKRPKDQKATMNALGLRKMNASKVVEGTPSVMGMVHKVKHLLTVEEVS